jgi:hypothetical protein
MPNVSKKKVKPNNVKCVWGLVCSLSSIDQQKNNISLFNVIDQLNIPSQFKEQVDKEGVISIGLEHEIVFLLRRTMPLHLCTDNVLLDMKISLVDPKGKLLAELLNSLSFEPKIRTLKYRVQNNLVRISTEGDYVYRAEIAHHGTNKFERVFEVPFSVQFI